MFRAIADLEVAGQVYAEGWQSWSPVRIHRAGEVSERAPDERAQKTEWRPDKPVAEGVIQAEGVLVVAPPDGPARAWFSPRPSSEVATLRAAPDRDRLVISADGPVEQVQGADLAAVLAAVGDRLGVRNVAHIPPGWCSWSCYFKHVTEADVMENVDAAGRLSLPIAKACGSFGMLSGARRSSWLAARRSCPASDSATPCASDRTCCRKRRMRSWTSRTWCGPPDFAAG